MSHAKYTIGVTLDKLNMSKNKRKTSNFTKL